MIDSVRGPENLKKYKTNKQTNKQKQKKKEKKKEKKGQSSNNVFITVHAIEWPNINIRYACVVCCDLVNVFKNISDVNGKICMIF